LNSARPAADCLLAAPEQFRETCASIARLAQASIAQVAWRAWRTKLRRNPAYAWGADMRFLSRAAVSEAEKAPAHPWLTAPGDALPGKAAHVALIAAAQSVAEGFDAEDELPVYSPLISQPLVETCLRVPSWLWFERGLNRAVARRAFSKCLPLETVQRRSKGAPDCFIAELFEVNRPAIRTMLMDGALRREGLLDVVALETALDDQAPVEGHDYLRIMQLVDAEAWATAWTAS
jgi:asparagine synthase (glutamine-hydrolysing)